MKRGMLAPFALGLLMVFALWAVGIAWPLTQGYQSLPHWLGDRFISERDPQFDREGLRADLVAAGFVLGDAAHIRVFKREKRLELWLRRGSGRYELFRSYDICTFSGELGPKLREGDRQSPEGFYRVSKAQLNPNSRHHLSFNLGFPNEFDRQLGRTGSALMVHGGCSSIGCYAITDAGVDQVYAVVEAALGNGQDAIDVHVFPFALTEAALAGESGNAWQPFWRHLKSGFDLFEVAGVPPKVAACGGEYRFGDDAEGPECVAIAAWS
jgi:murein L,D-transpeptidase YafK